MLSATISNHSGDAILNLRCFIFGDTFNNSVENMKWPVEIERQLVSAEVSAVDLKCGVAIVDARFEAKAAWHVKSRNRLASIASAAHFGSQFNLYRQGSVAVVSPAKARKLL